MPKGTAMRKTGMGTMGYAMSSQTKNPSATWKLLEYAYSDGLKFFMESYLIVPAISTYYDDPAWKDLPGPPYNNDIFIAPLTTRCCHLIYRSTVQDRSTNR